MLFVHKPSFQTIHTMTKYDDCLSESSYQYDDEIISGHEERKPTPENVDYVCLGELEDSYKTRLVSDNDDSDHSSKTYIKDEVRQTKSILKSDRSRPRTSLGILDPDAFEKKKARWLSCTSPSFLRRSSSADRKVVRKPPPEKEQELKRANVTCFKRSLKLLGFQPEDFDLKEDPVRYSTIALNPRSAPTFSTKLRKRSVSLGSLRSAGTSSEAVLDQLKRETLSKAVYEEWYFRKLADERMKRDIQERKENERKMEMEKARAERERKIEENFQQWKEMKKKLLKKQKRSTPKNTRSRKDFEKYKENNSKTDEAFEAWKAEKDKLFKLNQKTKEMKEKEKALKAEKNASAEAAFHAWKEQADAECKQKAKESAKLKHLTDEKKKIEMIERRENAKASFELWKEMKDNEIKQKLKETRLAAVETAKMKRQHHKERMYEAEQAFLEWLDAIEERLRIQKIVDRRRGSLDRYPAWSPGGSVQ